MNLKVVLTMTGLLLSTGILTAMDKEAADLKMFEESLKEYAEMVAENGRRYLSSLNASHPNPDNDDDFIRNLRAQLLATQDTTFQLSSGHTESEQSEKSETNIDKTPLEKPAEETDSN